MQTQPEQFVNINEPLSRPQESLFIIFSKACSLEERGGVLAYKYTTHKEILGKQLTEISFYGLFILW